MTAPLRIRRSAAIGVWTYTCRLCGRWQACHSWCAALAAALDHADAIAAGLEHLRTHAPVLRDATGWVALLGSTAAWCPLCDERIANGLAEDEARHVAAEHWEWHLKELGRTP